MKARLGVISATVLVAALAALAQRFGGGRFGGGIRHGDDGQPPDFPAAAEFHFIRTEYTDLPQFHRRFGFASRNATGDGWWIVDWPDADNHFSMGVERLTRIHTGDPRHLRLTDPHLFDYPWIYATQTGWWGLSDAETKCLREYLLRGGYLVLTDFWDPKNWKISRLPMIVCYPTAPSWTWRTLMPCCTCSTISRRRISPGSPARAICAVARAAPSPCSNPKAPPPPGAPSSTTGTACWWPSISIPTSAMPGSTPIPPTTPKP